MIKKISFRYQLFALFSITFQSFLPLINIFAPVQVLSASESSSSTTEIVAESEKSDESTNDVVVDEKAEVSTEDTADAEDTSEEGATENANEATNQASTESEDVQKSEEPKESAEPAVSEDVSEVKDDGEVAGATDEADASDPTNDVGEDQDQKDLAKVKSEAGLYVSYVVVGDTYKFEDSLGQNVELVFTRIDDKNGDLRIREVQLSEDQQKTLGALSEVGYDITSSMENGSFEYDLTVSLPESNGEKASLVYADDLESLDEAEEVKSTDVLDDELLALGLDHFTVFVVVNPLPGGVSNGDACTVASISGTCYDSLQSAVNTAAVSGDTIELKSDLTTTSQVTIAKSLTINGNGFTISPNFTKTSNSNNSVISINGLANTVTINDLVIDGVAGVNLHGINVYVSNAFLNDVTIKNNDNTAINVNGSEVTVDNFKSSGNRGDYFFGVIDLAKGSGVTRDPILTVNGQSSHSENIAIRRLSGSVIDTNGQYNNLVNIYYWLKTAPAKPNVNVTTDGNKVNANWNLVSGANTYEYQITGPENRSGTTSLTNFEETNLPNGNYDIKVRAVAKSGLAGAWSNTKSFTIAVYNPYIVKIDPYFVKTNYKGIGVDIHVNELTDATKVEVKIERANGDPVVKTNKSTGGVLTALNTGNNAVVTAPMVIQQGTYNEAGSSSWNQPTATWDYTNTPQKIIVTIERDNGNFPSLVAEVILEDIATPLATLEEVMPVNPHPDPNNEHQLSLGGTLYRDHKLNDCHNLTTCNDKAEDLGEGWTMRLYQEDEGGDWSLLSTAQTNASGKFGFPVVKEAGTYHMCEVVNPGWQQQVQNWSGTPYHINTDNQSGNASEGPYCRTVVYEDTGDKSNVGYFGNVDVTKPTTAIADPLVDGGIYNSGNLFVKFKSTDDQSGIAKVVANVHKVGKTPSHVKSCVNTTVNPFAGEYEFTCTINLDDSLFDDGEYFIRANARDAGNNISNTVQWNFRVDKTLPDLGITQVNVLGDSEVEFLGYIYDENFNHYYCWLTATSGGEIPNTRDANCITTWAKDLQANGNPATSTNEGDGSLGSPVRIGGFINLGDLEDGEYIVNFAGKDSAGNLNTTSKNFILDRTAPAMPSNLRYYDVLAGSEVACGVITTKKTLHPMWDANSEDDFSHYEYTSFDADNSVQGWRIGLNEVVMTSNKFEHSWMPPIDGDYGFAVRSVDNSGNKSDWSIGGQKTLEDSCIYTVDTVAPAKPTWGTVYKGHDLATATELQCGGITNDTEITLQWNANTEDDLKGYWFGTKLNPKHQWIPAGTNVKYGNMTPGHNPYNYTVIAVDNAGNESEISDQCGLTLDQDAPVAPNLVSPENNAFVNGSGITQSWSTTDSDIAYFIYESYHDEALTDLRWREEFTTTSKTATNVADGVYWWQVASVDHAGNIGPFSEVWKITVDSTAPDVNITNLTEGQFVSGTVNIMGTVKDINLSHYWLNITGPGYTGGPGTVNSPAINDPTNIYSWDTSLLTDGEYTIRLEARDKAGNKDSGSVHWLKVKLDNTAPTSTITPPENSVETAENTVILNNWDGMIAGTSADNLSGVKQVWLSIQNEEGKFWDGDSWEEGTEADTRVLIPTSGAWNYSMTPAPEAGVYTLKSHAEDNAGNVENTSTLIIIYDKTIPEVNLTIDPADPDGKRNWYISEPTITLTATDLNDIERIEYQWNGTAGAWTTYAGPVTPGQGNNIFYYRSIDKASNVSDIGNKTVQFDEELPENPETMEVDRNGNNPIITWSKASDNTGIHGYKVVLKHKSEDITESKSVGSNVREVEFTDLEDGEWEVSIHTEDLAGWSVSRDQDMTIGEEGTVAGAISALQDGLITPLFSNTIGSVLGSTNDAPEENTETGNTESTDDANMADGTEGQVAGASTECKPWQNYLPIILLVLQFMALLMIEFSLKQSTMPKVVLAVLVTVGTILLAHYLRNGNCYVDGSFLGMLSDKFWLASIVLSAGTRAVSEFMAKNED